MDKILRQNMLTMAHLYAKEKCLKIGAVGVLAARDAGFFSRIERCEGSFTVKKYDDVIGWFSDNWPIGAAWPADISRPISTHEAA